MTVGLRIRNSNFIVNIDIESKTYVYLGKVSARPVPNPSEGTYTYPTFTCVGVPIVYITAPYNLTGDQGVAVNRVISLGFNRGA